MGLAEKRAINEFQVQQYPQLEKQIHAAAGFAVKVTVNWDKLAADGYSHVYADSFKQVYFTPLMDGFKSICKDEMGRKALQGALKEIVITNTRDAFSDYWTFENGVLTIDHSPVSNVDYAEARTTALVELLESKL